MCEGRKKSVLVVFVGVCLCRDVFPGAAVDVGFGWKGCCLSVRRFVRSGATERCWMIIYLFIHIIFTISLKALNAMYFIKSSPTSLFNHYISHTHRRVVACEAQISLHIRASKPLISIFGVFLSPLTCRSFIFFSLSHVQLICYPIQTRHTVSSHTH